jgi:hypothetical protein
VPSSILSFASVRGRPSLLEHLRLYLRYMSVGVAAIPGGIVYGILSVKGYDRWWTALPSIALGLALGRMAWRYFDLKSKHETHRSFIQPSVLDITGLGKYARGCGVEYIAGSTLYALPFANAVRMIGTSLNRPDLRVKVMWSSPSLTSDLIRQANQDQRESSLSPIANTVLQDRMKPTEGTYGRRAR